LFWPDTRGLPLEEIAAIFGDEDEVAIYQAEIEIDPTTHAVIVRHKQGNGSSAEEKIEHVEGVTEQNSEEMV
jgi:hypothetical protein